jgi:hypothetical protein
MFSAPIAMSLRFKKEPEPRINPGTAGGPLAEKPHAATLFL